MKSTARAHSNIAFIKYWGRKNEELRLPTNGSISMNLSNLHTTTTVEFQENLEADLVEIDYKMDTIEIERVSNHLDRIRKIAGISTHARVQSINSFPSGTGLSSSASGFAALTMAGAQAAGLMLSEKELTILARQGSGSASRSIPNGFVEWKDAETSENSYSYSLYPADHWDIVDIVAVVSKEKKDISTSLGQQRVDTSVFFQTRLAHIQEKINICKTIISKKDFTQFGKIIEMEALELHAIMLTSWPSLIYWLPQSISLMKQVKKWREEGLEVYFTVNTGQDVHILCKKKDEERVISKLATLENIVKIISNSPSRGAYFIREHLF